ncbi:MAG TPA: NTP transferase domain-containing protein, partial [Bryobacteraceae bacterium]|nr:NTP transferase domain-containing protein [Bryobacteraceae bacterium]
MNELSVNIVILAAGLGTRMKSRMAKVLHQAGGLALVEHVVRSATAVTAPENVVVVTGHQAETVETLLGPYHVSFARQTEQLGTGHALAACGSLLSRRGGLLI